MQDIEAAGSKAGAEGRRQKASGRALTDFHTGSVEGPLELLPGEQKLLEAAGGGLPCHLGVGLPDPAAAASRVRAEFLCFLALGGDEGAPVHDKRIELHGALIEGGIDLESMKITRPLWLVDCVITGSLVARNAEMNELKLDGSKVAGVDLRFARVNGSVFLRRGFVCTGEVDLTAAVVTGTLNCNGARIENPGGKALTCGSAHITGDVQLREGFTAVGEVRFRRADIAGLLECNGATIKNPGGIAVRGGGARVGGGVFLRDGFSAEGQVRFPGAEILGELNCRGGIFSNPGHTALACENAHIKSNVFLSDGFCAHGETRFTGAEIGDLLQCGAGEFLNAGGRAFDCERARIAGHVWLNRGFRADGGVRLHTASIAGQLVCNGSFNNPGGVALDGSRAKIRGDVFLRKGFAANGETRFRGAEVGGSFICNGGTFFNPQPASGSSNHPWALYLSGAKIEGGLLMAAVESLRDENPVITGSLDLTYVQAGSFADHPDGWPRSSEGGSATLISLDGFTYGQFAGVAPTDAKTRQRWLLHQSPDHFGAAFRPQPFEQLVRVLRAMGHEEHARQIAMFKHSLLQPQRIRRSPCWSRPFVWLVGRLWGWLAGYGYRPHRLVVLLTALWLGCAGAYQLAAREGGFTPADPQVWTNADLVRNCGGDWTACPEVFKVIAFNPLIYSADMLLPVVDLGQRSAWVAQPGWTRAVSWMENLFGSLCVLLLGAILGGLVKRD